MNKKSIGFGVSTALKLLVYLIICLAAYAVAPLLGGQLQYFLPPAWAAIVTWVFLRFIEGGRRSFFAKGYMVENVIPGAVIGIISAALPMVILFLMGNVRVGGIASDFSLPEAVMQVIRSPLFAGIVIFGYIFHIIKQDFGNVPAVIISALLYCAFEMIISAGSLISIQDIAKGWRTVVLILTVAAAAGLCIIYLGDMLSAAAFLCFRELTDIIAARLLNISYKVSAPDILISADMLKIITMAVICLLLFIAAVKKR